MSILRLKRRQDFVRIASSGNRWIAPSLILQIDSCPSMVLEDHASDCRVGFTASRKIGNAVKRNRAKRRLRAAVQQIFPNFAKGGYDYVLIARSASIDCSYEQLLRDIEFCLSRVHRNLRNVRSES
ncbi:MAG: ribonuclease P protein component [Alphaproteobacteria bacterium]|nr:ribonuclease P protein component [Alphaproteobacteria bacterium]